MFHSGASWEVGRGSPSQSGRALALAAAEDGAHRDRRHHRHEHRHRHPDHSFRRPRDPELPHNHRAERPPASLHELPAKDRLDGPRRQPPLPTPNDQPRAEKPIQTSALHTSV